MDYLSWKVSIHSLLLILNVNVCQDHVAYWPTLLTAMTELVRATVWAYVFAACRRTPDKAL